MHRAENSLLLSFHKASKQATGMKSLFRLLPIWRSRPPLLVLQWTWGSCFSWSHKVTLMCSVVDISQDCSKSYSICWQSEWPYEKLRDFVSAFYEGQCVRRFADTNSWNTGERTLPVLAFSWGDGWSCPSFLYYLLVCWLRWYISW